ncbi:MAG TPA: sulfatase, partial [Clostridiales bacterium]|nr:sulfatase [Clostridiales bacterium]
MEERTKTPNILWICTDQQRFDTIRALGNPHIRTPNLDRLVREGVSFLNAYTQSPVCTPSRACFLTGRYPRTTRATKNGADYFPADEVLVTRLLADRGYDCGLVGKLHLSAAQGRVEVRPDHDGYRMFKWSHHPEPDWPEKHDYAIWLEEQGIWWEEHYQGRNGGIEPQFHQTTWCVNEAVRFMEEKRDGRPWLLSVNPFDPHPAFDPPAEYRQRYSTEDMPSPKWRKGELETKPKHQLKDYQYGGQDGAGPAVAGMNETEKKEYIADYYAMISLIDDQLGRLLDTLERTGQKENTVIFFHSDHGEMLCDHGLILKGAYFYQELVHIPLIVSWPGHFPSGVQSRALVELVDLPETILELTGQEVPYYMQGRSLLPILQGKA